MAEGCHLNTSAALATRVLMETFRAEHHQCLALVTARTTSDYFISSIQYQVSLSISIACVQAARAAKHGLVKPRHG